MDIWKESQKFIRKAEQKQTGGTLLEKTQLFCWETGLAPALNALPSVFGQEAVLYFPGRSGKLACPCYEQGGKILLALTAAESESISEVLLQSPGVEVWLKNGWYAGTARMLTAEEQADFTASVTNAEFFGTAAENFRKQTLQEHFLLEITRSAPCTGSSGPGSKAWIWALTAIFLMFSKKRK